MNKKQQQLTFEKGITNVPSDILCSDNTLSEAIGMVFENGEHRVIQKPKKSFEAGNVVLVYVHRIDSTTANYILVTKGAHSLGGGAIIWRIVSQGTLSGGATLVGAGYCTPTTDNLAKLSITSIGKTLIINYDGELKYFLYKNSSYTDIGTEIPIPKIRARVTAFTNANTECESFPANSEGFPAYTEPNDAVRHSASREGIFRCTTTSGPYSPYDDEANSPWPKDLQDKYNDLVLGLYAKNKKAIAAEKCFCNPLFVRIALELYDGSYYHIGCPILLLPAVVHNSWARLASGWLFTLYTNCRQIEIKQEQDYSDWSDIVKDVVIFASRPIDVYKTSGDVTFVKPFTSYKKDGVLADATYEYGALVGKSANTIDYFYNPLNKRNPSDIDADIRATSTFYKLCKIGKKSITTWKSTRQFIEEHVVENLETQEQLKYDDYYSGCPLKANAMFAYNSRLNLADVKRGFFKGFDYFAGIGGGNTRIGVTIGTENSDVHVSRDGIIGTNNYYFYYPDPRAKSANGITLTEHPGLNGAYYFRGMNNIYNESPYSPTAVSTDDNATEPLTNYVLTSEANNPWVFLASGYNKVGTGRIMGLSTVTTALSEGQFGQFPLLVFSTDGIWAMSLNGTGMFTSVHPMSREVCNNAHAITQTDGAVFFPSKKGLMVVVGSQVKCVSEQLCGNGDVFRKMLEKAVIAYDYRDSLLWLFDTAGHGSNVYGSRYCYIYSIKSGTFARFDCGTTYFITNVVSDYPDYLLQQNNDILTLLNRQDIDDDTSTYTAQLISRPMKLENGLALKSIMQVRHIKDFIQRVTTTQSTDPVTGDPVENTVVAQGSLAFHIFASNNLDTWVELKSLRGIPWKYYKFEYDFSNIVAVDRFAGSVIITQERRTDKLR